MRHKQLAWAQAALVFLGLGLCVWDMGAGLLISLVFLLPVIIAIDLGYSRERTGWMWGLFLGWLGVLILACMRAPQRPEAG
jgi:hypothetical protein